MPRRPLWHYGACAAAVLAAVFVLFWFNPSQYAFYPYCVFYKTTGLQCPGCGSLRALHQLLHGNLLEALRLNTLLVLALPGLSIWALRHFLRQGNGPSIKKGFWLWAALAIVLLFGIARNLPPVAVWLSQL
jgi:hypothetical protein